jgi:hypothetical protein
MRSLFLFFLISSSFLPAQKLDSIVLLGIYQGKNLYVQNPYQASGVGFCFVKITVNGIVPPDDCSGSAFEVPFNCLQVKIGDNLRVVIYHKPDCDPKVLNPEVLRPKSTFIITKFELIGTDTLSWQTGNEDGKLPFIVEQFRWHKWVRIGEVDGKGIKSPCSYSFKITDVHSGENKFRLKQIDFTSEPHYSDTLIYTSNKRPVTLTMDKIQKGALFSSPTMFEIYDRYGNILKKGYGDSAEFLNLERGVSYYLNFDNTMEAVSFY